MQIHELTQIMRQKDMYFANALNRIRVATPDEGSDDDLMLKSRNILVDVSNESYPWEAMHVYAQNIYCDEWNEKMLAKIDGNEYISIAGDSSKDSCTNLANIQLPERPHDTGNLRKKLVVKVGARVMLTSNIDVSDGLTNGAMGTVSHVVQDKFSQKIKTILVIFDNETIGEDAKMKSLYRSSHYSSVPIQETQATFSISGRNSCQACRKQFPLGLAWAVTIHKCQGLTLPEIVVDMTPAKGRFAAGQAYVAFSHVHQLQNLHIINYTRTQIRVSPHVDEEMACL